MAKKKPNTVDLTLRNLRSLKARIKRLEDWADRVVDVYSLRTKRAKK